MLDEEEKIKAIASAAQVACILEASIEKPGNVSPTHSFEDARYEDYILGSFAIRESIEEAARRGFQAGKGDTALSGIGIGESIHKGVLDIKKAHEAGNTHLGILLLFVPVSAAAGYSQAKNEGFSSLRKTVSEIISASTKKDSEEFYSAIKESGAGGLEGLREEDISFFELMKASSERDRLAEELTGGMQAIYSVGIPEFERRYKESGNIGAALLQTYLALLSKYPDTLIAKKAGAKEAEKVSIYASKAVNGEFSLEEFDSWLRKDENILNPGTTADMVCCVLYLWLLKEKVF